MKISFSYTLTLLLSLCAYFPASSQSSKEKNKDLKPARLEWNDGSIMLTSGEELKGMVRYNDQEGLLSYTDGQETRALNARNVAGFEFYDQELHKQRVFYTFELKNDPESPVRPYFFEVVQEFRQFAILSKVDPIEVERRHTSDVLAAPGSFVAGGNYKVLSQTETIFFMNAKGEIEPYLRVIVRDDMNADWTRVARPELWGTGRDKTKMVDEDLLAEYVSEPVYKQLKQYAKENDLKFRSKPDLLKILQYYAANFAR